MGQPKGGLANGIAWSFLERIISQGVSTLISIVLARKILPGEYGIIAAVTIFTSIATTFVTGGFGSALIQKKSADEKDFSTMFFFNMFFSVVIYFVVYFTAPWLVNLLNDSFEKTLLITVLRVLGVGIMFASFNSFYRSIIIKKLQFKKIFYVSIVGNVISAVIGIYMAYSGYGVWALIAHNLSHYAINSILFVCFSKWHPKLQFSFSRLKPMLSYGGKLLISSLLSTIYVDLNSLVIANRYDSEDLAYYKKGTTFPKLIVVNILNAINTALFPAMAYFETIEEHRKCVRKFNRLSTYLITPMMFGFAAVAPTFILIILTKKWLPCVVFLQISCINYALQPLGIANLQSWKASGNVTLYLVTDIVKKIIGVILIVVAVCLNKGVVLVAAMELLAAIIAIVITLIPGKKMINYSMCEQLKDVLPAFVLSSLMFVAVWGIGRILDVNIICKLIIQIFVGIVSYVGLSKMFKISEYNEMLSLARKYLKRKEKKTDVG